MARPQTNFYLGLDLGNGSIKIASDNFSCRIPSFTSKHTPANTLGCVIDGKDCYLVGKGALSASFRQRTVDDRLSKINGIQKLYFGALAHLPSIPKAMTNRVVVSSHAYKSHKDIIKANLEGIKEITLCGVDTTVTTEVLLVVPEGYGAVWNDKRDIALLDFGTGTTLLTTYKNGKPVDFIPSSQGVQSLFTAISKEMIAINGGYPGDEDEIRRSLERGEKIVDGINISKVYKDCLIAWWNDNIKDLSQEATKLSKEGYQVVCIGGGVALPDFANILTKKGFSPIVERPEMVNALGLYDLAVVTAKKKGLHVSSHATVV
jgi:Actin like proteins N terminal domain